ncbi:MAG: hypothetical protein KDC26_03085 [Armatimonadetes bacterium]|nr:hypothetical protein [Armatimonadota bacterium]
MKASLRALVDRMIDYAGLFPPAKLEMEAAVAEFLDIMKSDSGFYVDRFVCPAGDIEALEDALTKHHVNIDNEDASEIAVIAPRLSSAEELKPRIKKLTQQLEEARLPLGTLEMALPGGGNAHAATKAVMKSDLPEFVGQVYLEFGWGSDFAESLHEAASASEDVGFKARTGGVTAEAFPGTEQLAEFIVVCAQLEAPFKFTAGLHEPLRYQDQNLGVMRHGFLNAMVGSTIAVAKDATKAEVRQVLEITDLGAVIVTDEFIQLGDFKVTKDDIDDFWGYFGGFGSCSVAEPVVGLQGLGLLD